MKKIILVMLALALITTGCAQKFDNKNELKKSPCASLEVGHV